MGDLHHEGQRFNRGEGGVLLCVNASGDFSNVFLGGKNPSRAEMYFVREVASGNSPEKEAVIVEPFEYLGDGGRGLNRRFGDEFFRFDPVCHQYRDIRIAGLQAKREFVVIPTRSSLQQEYKHRGKKGTA